MASVMVLEPANVCPLLLALTVPYMTVLIIATIMAGAALSSP